jgi:Domain of unknown function (DUF4365)
MTPEQQKEEISKAYLHAVAAICGYSVGTWTQDHGGIDATVGAASTVGLGHLARPKVDIQLKASARTDLVYYDHISWQLDIDHYDSLRATASLPHILVVLLLPQDIGQAVEHTVQQLMIRRCAYWVMMTGMEAATGDSKTVHIPKRNVFTPDALRDILTKVSQGGFR